MQAVGATSCRRPSDGLSVPDQEGMVEIEVGWPVSEAFPGSERVELVTLPACTALAYVRRGPVPGARTLLPRARVVPGAQPLTVNGPPREINDTEEVPDPAEWLTEIQFPVAIDDPRRRALASSTA